MHNVKRNPMSRTYPEDVNTRLNKVVACITSLSLPFVQWGGKKEAYVSGVPTWPADLYAFPPHLWAPFPRNPVPDLNTVNI